MSRRDRASAVFGVRARPKRNYENHDRFARRDCPPRDCAKRVFLKSRGEITRRKTSDIAKRTRANANKNETIVCARDASPLYRARPFSSSRGKSSRTTAFVSENGLEPPLMGVFEIVSLAVVHAIYLPVLCRGGYIRAASPVVGGVVTGDLGVRPFPLPPSPLIFACLESISTLRRLKDRQRNATGEERPFSYLDIHRPKK